MRTPVLLGEAQGFPTLLEPLRVKGFFACRI